MKILLILLISLTNLYSTDIVIKSLQCSVNNNLSKLPILKLGSSDKMTIEFEIESEFEPSFSIVFKFCDSDWIPYDNLLLENRGGNILYNVNVKRLPVTTEGANYFVSEKFPQNQIEFPFSGKWMYFITDNQNTSIIYDYGKFFVVEDLIEFKVDVQKWIREGKISSNNALDRVLNFKIDFSIPDSLSPFNIMHIEIIKNFLTEYPNIIKKENYNLNQGYEWDGANKFQFYSRDIQPGNEYRQVNLRDKNLYEYPFTRAHFDGIQYSRFYSLGNNDFNGGFKLMDRNNEYSDYLVTKFEFSPPEEIDEDIFIVGPFSNWEVLPWFKLGQEKSFYSINIELKRGIYDYQYVTGRVIEDEVTQIDWTLFEGNFWETKNIYSVFLYYKTEELGGYDKIIGYSNILR